MGQTRDTYKYHQKTGNKIVHRGITDNIIRREQEHQQSWPRSHIAQIGHRTTREAALKWESEGGKR
jgi:predicted GIY-YIG superfamily endonuclease